MNDTNLHDIPLSRIHSVYETLLANGAMSIKEARRLLGISDSREVFSHFENNLYKGRLMLVYTDEPNEGGRIYPMEISKGETNGN